MEVVRKEYFQRLLGWKDKKMIKVITGIRRCGKSTLLKMFREYLLEQGVGENQIISINFEDYEYQELWQPKALFQYIKERKAGENDLPFSRRDPECQGISAGGG